MENNKLKIILDLANNHLGSVKKGKEIIKEHGKFLEYYKDIFDIYFKFQYRALDDGFIHSEYKNSDFKYVKRFQETKLTNNKFLGLKNYVEELGFNALATPFDEKSVDFMIEHNYDMIKIASCSALDWPLLNKIAETKKPVIISVAGVSLEDIDKIVLFFENRNIPLILQHCIAEYPTEYENLQLNQIDVLKKRYPNIGIGFSTHEDPYDTEIVMMAIAKGVCSLERHIDTNCTTKNTYSSTPGDMIYWLDSVENAIDICGIKNQRYIPTEKEKEALNGLKRGVWLNKDIKKGDKIKKEDIFCAIPIIDEDQLIADNMSKYIEYTAKEDMLKNEALYRNDVDFVNIRKDVLEIVNDIRDILLKARIALPQKIDMELSHHYGLQEFKNTGAVILNFINNEEYCKKLLILFPEQNHPMHYHIKKHETFSVLYGEMMVIYTEKGVHKNKTLKAGDVFAVDRNLPHGFSSETGCVFEEVSTTHYKNDSYYEDEFIRDNPDRKTNMVFYSDWLEKELK